MFQTLCALLLFAQLTPKDLKPNPSLPAQVLPAQVRISGTSVFTCAIPLKEVRAGNGRRIDPIAPPNLPTKPNLSTNIDKGIAHAAPLPVCPSRR